MAIIDLDSFKAYNDRHPAGHLLVGLASWDFQEASADLLARADQALYLAKAEGRDRYVLAS